MSTGFMSDSRYQRRVDRRRRFGNTVKGAWNSIIPLIRGQGDYTIVSGGADQVPQFANSPGYRSFRIAHREFISDVESSTNFVNRTFALNPANSAVFPWLSNMAQNFQEYVMHGLVFQFTSTSADALNSTNTALGTVIMGTDYNAGNAPYVSKQAAENAEFTVSCRPSQSLRHAIECDPAVTVGQGHLYVSPLNNGTVPAGQDPKTYNLGTFQLMTQGSQAVATIGELWVTYDIEFLKPIDNSQLFRSAADHYTLADITGGPTNIYLGTATKTLDGIGTTVDAGGVITFPENAIAGQKYLLSYFVVGTAENWTIDVSSFQFANCSPLVSYRPTTGVAFAPASTTASTTIGHISMVIEIDSTASSTSLPTVELTAGMDSIPSTASGFLVITQVPGNFV